MEEGVDEEEEEDEEDGDRVEEEDGDERECASECVGVDAVLMSAWRRFMTGSSMLTALNTSGLVSLLVL